ncbi:MAG: DUF421 domain-containing protein [Acidobacteriota bacterium]
MFHMNLPWWEFAVRGAITYAALLILVRVSGKRTVGQYTPFELIVVLLLSEGVSPGLTGGDNSVAGGLIVVTVLIGLNWLVAFATSRSERLETLFDGSPVLLGRNGEVFTSALRRYRVGLGEFNKTLREADCEIAKMRYAILETDGTISIQKTQDD